MRIICGIAKPKPSKEVAFVRFVDKKEFPEASLSISSEKAKELFMPLDEAAKKRRGFLIFLRRIVVSAKKHGIKIIAVSLEELPIPEGIAPYEAGSLLAENFLMANFEFVDFKTKPKGGWNMLSQAVIYGKADGEFKKGVEHGEIVGEEVNNARILSNTPGGDMTPRLLADRAKKAARAAGIRISVLNKREIEKEKMGAILGVARGSAEEPKFIILEYRKGEKNERPIVLVGKGVTFDTGGLNLKPTTGISDMHLDMSGGAAVIHSIVAAARLGLKKNIIGLVPAVENMPSGESYRPGDILRSLSGKTIEVLNTDAEGRLILADALTYAKRFKPRLVIDVATLTVASVVALGQRASVVFSTDEKLREIAVTLGEQSGDYLWPLPLWEEYEEDVKGNFADFANIPPSGSSYGGAINGATFLHQFVKEGGNKTAYPWAHIDMAPRMTSIPSDILAKGAAGAPVRLLAKLLESY